MIHTIKVVEVSCGFVEVDTDSEEEAVEIAKDLVMDGEAVFNNSKVLLGEEAHNLCQWLRV
jgi:hypothetical protein